MSKIPVLSTVSRTQLLAGIEPAPTEGATSSARVVSDSAQLLTDGGVRAGSTLDLEFDSYFPPLPDAEGYGSSKLQVHWKVGNLEGDAPPVQASGWWGYGTHALVDVPASASGKMELTLQQLRVSGVPVPPVVVTTDVLPTDAPILKFDESWQNAASEQLVPGGAFQIAYDVDRLRNRLQLAPGERAQITAFVSFDGRYPESRPLLVRDGNGGERVDMPELRIPQDARSLRIWFSAAPANNPRAAIFDSDFGRDFEISLV